MYWFFLLFWVFSFTYSISSWISCQLCFPVSNGFFKFSIFYSRLSVNLFSFLQLVSWKILNEFVRSQNSYYLLWSFCSILCWFYLIFAGSHFGLYGQLVKLKDAVFCILVMEMWYDWQRWMCIFHFSLLFHIFCVFIGEEGKETCNYFSRYLSCSLSAVVSVTI